jgi:8-oxo-dGTP diphosphatase
MSNKSKVGVGIGVVIIRDNTILLGKRKNKHGQGTWCEPGGHLELGESWEECAIRETMEETGIKIKNIRFGAVTNDIFSEEKQYITICMVANYDSGEPAIMEPDKFTAWDWFDWDNLPSPLFLPMINRSKQNFNPFDILK